MQDSVEASAVIQAILGLCAELKIPVVAEGVETAEQCQTLQDLNCQLVQGFYFSHPQPLAHWLKP
jgi:EAL domain-containing protein (putative c-di-GMP-specific phosphodiesterase class I)